MERRRGESCVSDESEKDELRFGLRLALCKVNFHAGQFGSAISTAEQLLDEVVSTKEAHDSVEYSLRHAMVLNALAVSRLGALDFFGALDSSSITGGAKAQVQVEDMLTEVEECRHTLMTATGMLAMAADIVKKEEKAEREQSAGTGTTYSTLRLASAASLNNAGIARLLCALLKQKAASSAAHDTDTDPLVVAVDEAIITWKEGLAQLDRIGLV